MNLWTVKRAKSGTNRGQTGISGRLAKGTSIYWLLNYHLMYSPPLSLPKRCLILFCFWLVLSGGLAAQIPDIYLPEEELLLRIEANSRDERHFDAVSYTHLTLPTTPYV